jgi:hypothetical protein
VIQVLLVSGQIARIGVADKYERPPGFSEKVSKFTG